ncbi:hematopoietic prostaglandin D synthase-like [Acipenser oxyrinchus oxyrinchus]|uniref:glutathione transferase n=1 Tax=Acipenser oxyrinchus oxyrinchus TaxID=40147 RepID=A0AAD8GHT4_ACIOX|nr:hematopoietic prostaglandin D synthase-like [Acipenser oxyrinchus oxyrinchus]
MSTYKLSYFNMRGRAELARYIFAYAGIQYEDIRIEWVNWPTIKPSIPFLHLPVMEVDGVIIHQSLAISRYLAREAGLVGKSILEQAQTDALVDSLNDFTTLIPWNEKDKILKKKLLDDLFDNEAPVLLQNLENQLGNKDWFVGDSVTWVDFYWDVCFTTFITLRQDFAANYPNLLALKDRVEAIPQIAEWIKNRPQTVL